MGFGRDRSFECAIRGGWFGMAMVALCVGRGNWQVAVPLEAVRFQLVQVVRTERLHVLDAFDGLSHIEVVGEARKNPLERVEGGVLILGKLGAALHFEFEVDGRVCVKVAEVCVRAGLQRRC